MEEPNEAVSSSRVNIVDINENASTQYSGLVIQVSHPAHSAQIKTTRMFKDIHKWWKPLEVSSLGEVVFIAHACFVSSSPRRTLLEGGVTGNGQRRLRVWVRMVT